MAANDICTTPAGFSAATHNVDPSTHQCVDCSAFVVDHRFEVGVHTRDLISELHNGFAQATDAVDVQTECGDQDEDDNIIHTDGCGCNMLTPLTKYEQGSEKFYATLDKLMVERETWLDLLAALVGAIERNETIGDVTYESRNYRERARAIIMELDPSLLNDADEGEEDDDEQGACVLTGAEGENADDCTTHAHEAD